MALLKMPLREVLPKSVLSGFRSSLDDNLYSDVEDWITQPKIAKVIQVEKLTVPHDGRPYSVETKELYMIWPPGEMTSSDDCGANNKHCKTPLSDKQLVTLTVDTELNMKNRSSPMMQDTKLQSSLIRVKRRYLVEIPVRRPNVETGGGDATNVSVIHTTLLMVTAHCQLCIQTHGQEFVMIPSTEDIIAYGDGCPSKLTHSTSVDSGYRSPTLPSLGSIDGPNFFGQTPNKRQADDSQEQTTVVQHIIQNDTIGADSDKLKTRSSVDSGLGVEDRMSLSRQITKDGSVVEVLEKDATENESVQADSDKGGNRVEGLFGVKEPENAAIFQAQAEYIREDFAKAEMVDQLARGELVREMGGGPVPVESGEKDVDMTVKNEKLKKEDSLNEGNVVDLEASSDDKFKAFVCCDILLPYYIYNNEPIKALLDKLRRRYPNLVVNTFDGYHLFGTKDQYEAVIRSSKIFVYLGTKPDVAIHEKLLLELATKIGNEKRQLQIVAVKQKDFRMTLCPKHSLLHCAPQLDENKLLDGGDEVNRFINERRDKTVAYVASVAAQCAEKMKTEEKTDGENMEEDHGTPHVQRSDSGIEIEFNPDEIHMDNTRKDFLFISHNCDAMRQLLDKFSSSDKKLLTATPDDFLPEHGIHKVQAAIENSDKVILYATRQYAEDDSMTKALDWQKAIKEKREKFVVVVPNGTTNRDYNAYKMKLGLARALQTFYEDKESDINALIQWSSQDSQ